MASSSLTTPVMKDGECRNWAELPSELTSDILRRLDTIDILVNAQKVCTSWYRVCKDPAMWRKIDMRNLGKLGFKVQIMCRHAIDRSQGGLLEIDIPYFATRSLLNYIVDRSSSLRSLRITICYPITDGLTEAIVNLPSLEELGVSYYESSGKCLKVVGQSLPNLKTLKLNCQKLSCPWHGSDDDALAIAEMMPGLRFLQLHGNLLSDIGLNAILDNCPNLEHLDLRRCLNVNIVGDLEKRCLERIKVLRRPRDSADDFPYYAYAYLSDEYDDYGPEVFDYDF